MVKKIFALTLFFVFAMYLGSFGQDIVGKWKTIDDKTNKVKSVIEIGKNPNGTYFGKITKLFKEPGEDPDPKCDKCKGSRHNQKIIGMIILNDLKKKSSNMWDGGKIIDPETGDTYDCKMWIEKGNLQVRGYMGWSVLGRSQTWLPYKE